MFVDRAQLYLLLIVALHFLLQFRHEGGGQNLVLLRAQYVSRHFGKNSEVWASQETLIAKGSALAIWI